MKKPEITTFWCPTFYLCYHFFCTLRALILLSYPCVTITSSRLDLYIQNVSVLKLKMFGTISISEDESENQTAEKTGWKRQENLRSNLFLLRLLPVLLFFYILRELILLCLICVIITSTRVDL